MKNIILTAVVVTVLAVGGLTGTLAGFVDTEVSQGNRYQAGIMDLLINGENDPDVPRKVTVEHGKPSKSYDFWIDAYNRALSNDGFLYMHFKDVESIETGWKIVGGVPQVYQRSTNSYINQVVGNTIGPDLASSEPEWVAEHGGIIGQYTIPNPWGMDYASGIADHLDVRVEVPHVGPAAVPHGSAGNYVLGDPDTDNDGDVDATEYVAWVTAGNHWWTVPSLTGKMVNIESNKDLLGELMEQTITFIHVDVHLQQIEDPLWDTNGDGIGEIDYDGDGDVDADDAQLKDWPTNALQGDQATWDMLFELTQTDP